MSEISRNACHRALGTKLIDNGADLGSLCGVRGHSSLMIYVATQPVDFRNYAEPTIDGDRL